MSREIKARFDRIIGTDYVSPELFLRACLAMITDFMCAVSELMTDDKGPRVWRDSCCCPWVNMNFTRFERSMNGCQGARFRNYDGSSGLAIGRFCHHAGDSINFPHPERRAESRIGKFPVWRARRRDLPGYEIGASYRINDATRKEQNHNKKGG